MPQELPFYYYLINWKTLASCYPVCHFWSQEMARVFNSTNQEYYIVFSILHKWFR